MMQIVIDRLVEILSAAPGPVLPASGMGARKPSGGSDLPAVVFSISLDDDRTNGMGRLLRDGNVVAQSTSTVTVAPSSDGFTPDLKSLRITPLPLKRNPASTGSGWSEKDLRIRNITRTDQPVDYRLVEKPALPTEFTLEPAEAVVTFGQAQQPGDLLEVVHWTVTWMDDIVGQRFTGLLALEVWTNNRDQLEEVSGRLQMKLADSYVVLRQRGFLRLQPSGLEAAENVRFQPATGSPISIWSQRLSYRFRFEAEPEAQVSSGIPIRRIDVNIEQPREPFAIPRG